MTRPRKPVAVTLLVAVVAGFVMHVALCTPLALSRQRADSLLAPAQVLPAIVGWSVVAAFLPGWWCRGSAWLAVSVGWVWGLASVAVTFLFALVLSFVAGESPGRSDGGALFGAVLVSIGAAVTVGHLAVPIGVVGALVIRALDPARHAQAGCDRTAEARRAGRDREDGGAA